MDPRMGTCRRPLPPPAMMQASQPTPPTALPSAFPAADRRGWAATPLKLVASLARAVVALFFLVQAATAQELPLRFEGDGATLVVNQLDEAAGKVVGTLQVPGGNALPFTLLLTERSDGLQVGKGKVQTGTIARRISTRENEDGSVRVTYRAKRYVVSLTASGAQDSVDPASKPSAAAPSTHGTIRLKRHTFNDKGWGGRPSHTMLVPDGWQVKGGAFWAPPAYFQVMPSQEIEVTSPEGHSLRIEPAVTAKDITPPGQYGMARPKEGMSDQGYPIFYMPLSLPEWKTWMQDKILPATYENASKIRVREVQVVPELTAIMVKQYEPFRRMILGNSAMDASMGQRTTMDFWVLGFSSTYEIDGKSYEEMRLMAVYAMTMDSQMLGRSILWSQDRSFSFRAPVGELEQTMPLFSTLANSLQMTQPWMNMKADLFAKIMKSNREVALSNMRASQKRSAILSKAYSDAADISREGYRSRNASQDAGQASFLRTINEVDLYSTPGSDTKVELPSGYSHVYSNGNDEYLLTNDALLDPNVDLGAGSWTTMQSSGR